MRRRDVLHLPLLALAQAADPSPDHLSRVFLDVLRGYLDALQRTSPSLAVCEFYDATVTNGFRAKSGLSVTAVTRMLPAIAAWILSGRKPQTFALGTRQVPLLDVVLQMCRTAFDPDNPDYWRPAPENRSDQRQVESSVVAWSFWLLRDTLLPKLTATERKRINDWLASCTRHPVRNNNWAWFTAVNQAVRLDLARTYPEFNGDERWMLDDLAVLDAMARGDEGWYSDSLSEPMFDYYNSWVFASHFLYWNKIVGARYPQSSEKFKARLRKYLETAPLFFGANGSHVLYGRSLIYRWGVLTPLVLAYEQKLLPHSPDLLRALCRRNIDYFWSRGAFDAQHGKLRETLTADGSDSIKESYIDGGHPYWGMQAFAMFLIPARDAFWTAHAANLPVEDADFALPIHSAGLLLTGNKRTGEVRLYNALSTRAEIHYRDKYNKFAYSTNFPMCVVQTKTMCPWDSAVVLREIATGATAGRGAYETSEIRRDGVDLTYSLKLNSTTARVRTRIRLKHGAETWEHDVEVAGPAQGYELVEGSPALGEGPERFTASQLRGWTKQDIVTNFGPPETARSNVVLRAFNVVTRSAPLSDKPATYSATFPR